VKKRVGGSTTKKGEGKERGSDLKVWSENNAGSKKGWIMATSEPHPLGKKMLEEKKGGAPSKGKGAAHLNQVVLPIREKKKKGGVHNPKPTCDKKNFVCGQNVEASLIQKKHFC